LARIYAIRGQAIPTRRIKLMRYLKPLAAAVGLSLISISILTSPATAKRPYTITERIETFQKDIARDQKTGDLTKKEADDLRDSLSKVNEKITKMKSKNGGKLSYKDEGKIEKELNDVSLDLKKRELNKRVISK
jgi:hypothetical protein